MANRTKLKSCAVLSYRDMVKGFQPEGVMKGNDPLCMAFVMAESKYLEHHHKLVAPSYFLVAASELIDPVKGFELTDYNIERLGFRMFNLISSMDFRTAINKAEQIIQASLKKGAFHLN